MLEETWHERYQRADLADVWRTRHIESMICSGSLSSEAGSKRARRVLEGHRRISRDVARSAGSQAASVVPANPDHIDRLGVVAYYSTAVRALVHGANRLIFRLVSEPCCAPAGDSRAAPPTRSPSTLREAVETHAPGSTLVIAL
jgi:hypothetical protein